MGLDMYAYAVRNRPETPVDFYLTQEVETRDPPRDVFYWRKHPNLHGWMERLYREKGGKEEDFNLVNVILDPADLDRLEADVRADALPQTTGFFFGASHPDDKKDDLDFIGKARDLIKGGWTVYYTSWW